MYNEHVTLGNCFILMGFMFSMKLFILARCRLKNSLTLKCQKFNGNFFYNVTPLFKTLRTGLHTISSRAIMWLGTNDQSTVKR